MNRARCDGILNLRRMSDDAYIIRYDADPEFWQFLNGLARDDLITELIQNELDAGQTGRVSILEFTTLSAKAMAYPLMLTVGHGSRSCEALAIKPHGSSIASG